MPQFAILSQQAKTIETLAPDSFNLRIHRALSWLKKAEAAEAEQDLDIQFVALWVSFNAAYAREISGYDARPADKSTFREFLQRVCHLDKNKVLYNLIWQTFSGHIRVLLDNHYTFQFFWDYHNGLISENAWRDAEQSAKTRVNQALRTQDTGTLLMVVFERLYTLRNQLVHGGATYASSANRAQLKNGCAILASLVPNIIAIMLANHQNGDWGKPFYPFVRD